MRLRLKEQRMRFCVYVNIDVFFKIVACKSLQSGVSF